LLIALTAAGGAQGNSAAPLPLDPAVRTGTLKNGLTYFIRKNAKPEDRAELRLVVKAGSVLEDPEQQGLAHFVEHMAFNGTKNFKKHEIVDFMESAGMRFGADLNAYTSFDETVYKLQLPTDDPRVLDRGVQVLEDWAHNVSFEDEEIDKERGVVMEEWRLRQGADNRMREITMPVVFQGSRYPQRLPIGKTAVLDTFRHETLRRFYRDWYRPELMAVVAVGDFDPEAVRKMIEDHFNRIPPSVNPRPRFAADIPDHPGTLVVIATDPEATSSSVNVRTKFPYLPSASEADYRRGLIEDMISSMLGQRFDDLRRAADPPFLGASFGISGFNTAKRFVDLSAAVQNGGVERGIEAILTEAERARRHGFTQGELDRARQDILRGMEQFYSERDKIESDRYTDEYVSYFLEGTASPSVDVEYALYERLLPAITLDEVNAAAKKLLAMQENNRVIAATSPKKEGVAVPTEAELRGAFKKIAAADISPYVDNVTDQPLLASAPVPGRIVEEKRNAELGTIEWKLSNGARVVLKPTDFKNDEILFTASSSGGYSLTSDANVFSASLATTVVGESGLGSHSRSDLEKLLTGKAVRVAPYIGELQEGLNGMASPKDLETMFQLINLCFVAPRRDSVAFTGLMARTRASIQNRTSRPEQVLYDSIQATLSQHNPRRRPLTAEDLATVSLDSALDFYRDRFADAGDFSFFFVGSLKPETIRPLVETYLASLPSSGRHESWRDLGIRPPKGVVSTEAHQGAEPKSQVALIFTGPFVWNRENRHLIDAVTELLEYRMREVLREDKGGTYGVGVYATPAKYPEERYSMVVNFGCSPDRVDELTKAALGVIEEFKKNGPAKGDMEKMKETGRRERESQLKKNGFWLGSLQSSYLYGDDPNEIPHGDRLIEQLTPEQAKAAAIRYFDMNNYIKAILYPERRTP
jgi:zinc protease